MANTYLTRTVGTPTNIDKYTFSVWIKRGDIGQANSKIFSVASGSNGEEKLEFNNDDLIWRQTAESDGNNLWQRVTDRKFRDCNSWYNIVVAYDSSDSTAGNRCKMYINGVQETSFSGSADPSSNLDSYINKSGSTLNIGKLHNGTSQNFGGSMSHMHFIDGTAYPASAFGSTDSTTGEWQINTSPSVTYGNNGFFWLKDSVATTDHSPNSNTFTVSGGTLTKTEDCPSNVFATLNTLDSFYDNVSTFTNGNTTYATSTSNGNYTFTPATLGFNSGKWYWEQKITSNVWMGSGISSTQSTGIGNYLGQNTNDYAYYGHPYATGVGSKWTGGTKTNFGADYTTNDILMYAVDCDNLKIYTGKNGTWNNSGDPTSGSTGTGAMYTITNPSLTQKGFYFPSACTYDTSSSGSNFNFGNGYFGTTAVSSAGTNASGNGIFEFNVPTGFTALSTKGLNL